MNYIGSKHTLAPFICQTIFATLGRRSGFSYAEIFGGTGSIARNLKPHLTHCAVNDVEPYSHALLRHYIGNTQPLDLRAATAALNALPGADGLIYQHYCAGGGTGRQYFSDANGRRIDAIRQQLGAWRAAGTVSEDAYYALLAMLLEAADKVANTASVYGAFLKHLKRSAQQPLLLPVPTVSPAGGPTAVYNEDANALAARISGDVLYLDPPYNARQYGANYHLLNTITLYDDFEPQGVTGLRPYGRSPWCSRKTVGAALTKLIEQADFEYVFLSYNNEGLLTLDEVRQTFEAHGAYALVTKEYGRFRADKEAARQHKADTVLEYLHVLRRNAAGFGPGVAELLGQAVGAGG